MSSAVALWRIARRLFLPGRPKAAGFEWMSNEDVDRWLEQHNG